MQAGLGGPRRIWDPWVRELGPIGWLMVLVAVRTAVTEPWPRRHLLAVMPAPAHRSSQHHRRLPPRQPSSQPCPPTTHITGRSTLSRPWIPRAWVTTVRARPGVAPEQKSDYAGIPLRSPASGTDHRTGSAGWGKARVRPVSMQSGRTVRSGPPSLAGVIWLAVDFAREWQRLTRFPPMVVFALPRVRYGSWPIS